MGLLNSALHTGQTALMGYQTALQVVGNNVSSAGSEDYTRLSADMSPLQGGVIGGNLQPGAGVALTGIQRNIDEALEGRLRLAAGTDAYADAQLEALSQIESLFSNVDGSDIGTTLVDFLNNFDELQNRPDDVSTRDLALTSGAQLATSISTLRSNLTGIAEDLDGQIASLVVNADDLARQIAELNAEITTAEAGTNAQASSLRDQRDGLLRDLSVLFDVTVREQPNGSINVYVGSEALVQGSYNRGLIAVEQIEDEIPLTSVRFADTNQQIGLGSGRLAGLIAARDEHALGQVGTLDRLAVAVITEVNRIHADGQGLTGFTATTGTVDVLSRTTGLADSATGLANPPEDGSFFVTVLDDLSGTPVSYQIDVNITGESTDTTLETLVTDFNAQVDGVTASITSDNRIAFTADTGRTFVFGYDGAQAREDTSGVLAALGVNTLFTGHDARDIAVNEALIEQPSLLAAASVNIAGNGSNAGRIASLDTAASTMLGDVTITEFYNSLTNSVAVSTAAANQNSESASSVLSSLQTQKESISGVNLDEEAISLLKYERAYQGAARFIQVVDELLDELMLLAS